MSQLTSSASGKDVVDVQKFVAKTVQTMSIISSINYELSTFKILNHV